MQIPGIKLLTKQPINERSTRWLAVLVLLAQLPHYLHLPWWVSAFGATVVAGRMSDLYQSTHTEPNTQWARFSAFVLAPRTLALFAALTAIAVRMHYGYFLGRDPCVAFLFLLVSFKFAETRYQKDATILVCLAGFLLLTQYFYSQTILSALVSLPAVLTLGGVLQVLRNHCHPVPVGNTLRLTLKLLLQGAPIAAALFLLFPRLPGPLWNLPNDATSQTGLSDTMAPGSISALSLSDAVAFRVDFDGEPPASADRYWRGPVLSLFDGREWTVDKRQRPATPESAIPLKQTQHRGISYTVSLEPHRRQWLFALDVPSSLPVRITADGTTPVALATMMSDLQLLAPTPVNNTIRYRQNSTLSSTYTETTPPLIATTQIAGRNTRAEHFAQQLRRQYPDDHAFTDALLRWFNHEEFYYTLQPDLLGDQPVDEFLFESRRGFCEHYASAFVFLLRAASIPARVVTGYLGGEMNGDYMIVRQSDAHAWAEGWIEGAWRRFDPTAAVAPSRVETGLASALTTGEPVPALARAGASWLKSAALRWDAINHDWQRFVVDFDNQSQNSLWQSLGLSPPAAWQITALMLAAAGIWCWIALGMQVGYRRTAKTAEERLWNHYCTYLSAAGLPRSSTEGPQDYCRRTIERWPAWCNVFTEITRLLNALRYARPDAPARDRMLHEARSALKRLPSKRVLRRHQAAP